MGKIKHLGEIRRLFEKSPVVTSRDLRLIVRNDVYARLMVSNMIKREEIKKLVRGFYTIHEDPSLAVFCFKPAYIGLEEALSIRGLWEQETNTVIVTAGGARIGTRKVFEQSVIVHRIDRKYMFGFELVKYGDFYIPVSDIEKTFIDIIYFNRNLGKDVMDGIKKAVDRGKLEGYLKPYNEMVKRKVMWTMAV